MDEKKYFMHNARVNNFDVVTDFKRNELYVSSETRQALNELFDYFNSQKW